MGPNKKWSCIAAPLCFPVEIRTPTKGTKNLCATVTPPEIACRGLEPLVSSVKGRHLNRSTNRPLTPKTGFEPVTVRLTAECSTAELLRNIHATSRTRTCGQLLRRQLLYPLSYGCITYLYRLLWGQNLPNGTTDPTIFYNSVCLSEQT